MKCCLSEPPILTGGRLRETPPGHNLLGLNLGARVMNLRTFLSCVAVTVLPVATAVAQQAPESAGPLGGPGQVGKVVEIEGPQGSVIVVRGSQAYSLVAGDVLFEGDRIVTRSNGVVTISANGCEKTLSPTMSVIVDDELCNVAPITLVAAESIPELAAQSVPQVVGATPFFLPGLAAAGASAAALNGSRSRTTVVQ